MTLAVGGTLNTNTTRRKNPFVYIGLSKVKIYSCNPTMIESIHSKIDESKEIGQYLLFVCFLTLLHAPVLYPIYSCFISISQKEHSQCCIGIE